MSSLILITDCVDLDGGRDDQNKNLKRQKNSEAMEAQTG